MPITDTSYNYITVSFNAPVGSPPIGYYATATPVTTFNKQRTIVSGTQVTNTPIKLTGLVSGTTYSINITSIYSINNSVSGNILGDTDSAPVTGLSITNPTVNSLTIGYTRPLGSKPIGYFATAVPQSTDNGQTTVVTSETTATLIVISGLISGTTYTISVSSIYDTGPVVSSTSQGATLSSPPSNLVITDISYNYLKVGYVISSGSTALGYFATATNATTGSIITSNTSFANPLTISNLVSGSVYNVIVSAAYSNTNTPSFPVSATTPSNPPIISGITDSSYNYLTVAFTAPLGNTPNSYYATAVPVRTNNSQQTVVSSTVNSISPITLSGLISGSKYYVTVSANYNNGTVTSSSVGGNTTATYPTSLVITNPTVYSLTIGYVPPISSPPIGYYATAYPQQTDNGQSIVTTSMTTSTLITINGLISGTIYNVNATSVYDTGNIVSSSTVQGITVSNPPTNVVATGLLINSISLSYSAPIGNTPLGYYAIAVPNSTNNGQTTVNTLNTNGLTNYLYLTIPNLVSGTSYTINAYSRYSNGDLSSNNVISSTASFPPTNLQFVSSTVNSITVSFTPPIGSLPTSYLATTALGGSGTANANATQITISGLSINTSYPGITVAAVYSGGNQTSTSITASTIGYSATNLTVIDVSVNYMTLSFTPPASLPNSYSATTNQGGAGTASQSATTITIFNLTPNTYYTGIAITSIFTGGTVTSSSINYYTLGYQVTNLSTIGRINSIDVSFTAPLQANAPIGYFARAVPNTSENGQSTIVYPDNVSTTSIPTSVTNIPLTIPGLTSGTIYTITIASVYNSGNVVSVTVSGTTTSNPPLLTSITGGNNSLTVYFTPPTTNTAVIGYIATVTPDTVYSANGQTTVTTTRQSPTSATSTNSIVVSGLISGSKYGVVVTAVYNTTSSVLNSTSTDLSGTTLSASPTITQVNQYPVDISSNSITVYFNAPSGYSLPLRYSATAVPETFTNSQQVVTVTGISKNATSVMIGNLVSGTAYDISMASIYDAVNVSSSVYYGATTLSNPPTNVLINSNYGTDASTNSITVYYTKPLGSLPISYSVIVRPLQTENSQQTITINGISKNVTSYVVGNLVSGSTYDVSMISVYNTGNQNSTTIARGNTLSNSPTLTAINSNYGTDASTNALTVYFTAPIGSLPLSYSLTAKPEQTDNTQTTLSFTGITKGATSYVVTGLISGSTYDISMSAVYNIATNSTAGFLTGNTLSGAPILTSINSTVGDASTNALTVYFAKPLGSLPLSYSLTAKPETTTNSQTTVSVTGVTRGATSYTFTGLISGTTYDVSMSAVYDTSTNSTAGFLRGNTLSGAPTLTSINSTVGDASTNALTVYFTAPVGSLPISYSLTAKPETTTNSQTTVSVTGLTRGATSYSFTGLISGTTYDVSMSAVYDISTNSTSGFLRGNTLSNAPILTAINSTVGDSSTNAVTVYFTAPVGSLPISYSITAKPETTSNSQTTVSVTGITKGATSYIVGNLISGTTYDVSMSAVYDISTNSTAGFLRGNTLSNAPTLTAINSTAGDASTNAITVYFTAPIGSLPINYSLTAKPETTTNSQVAVSVTGITKGATSYTFTSLVSGTTYDVSMSAVYDISTNSTAGFLRGNTLSNAPTLTAINSTVGDASTNALTVYFTAPVGSLPISYSLTAKPETTTNSQVAVSISGITKGATSYTFTSLVSGTTYDVSMSAVYDISTNSTAGFLRGNTLSNAPTLTAINSTVGDASTNALTVYFTAPVGSLPISYSLTAKPEQTDNTQVTSSVTGITRGATSYIFTNLVSGSTYDVSMSAVYDISTNSTSGFLRGNTLSNTPTITGINSTVGDASTNALTLYFTAPLGSLPLTYSATLRPKTTYNSQSNVNITGITKGATSYIFKNLISGTAYDISLAAIYDICSNSTGYYATPGTTLSNSPTITSISNASTNNYLSISYTAPTPGSAPVGYYVTATPSASNNSQTTITYPTSPTYTNFTNSNPIVLTSNVVSGTTYNVVLTALYDAGNTTSSSVPGNSYSSSPTGLTISSQTTTTLTVTFNAPSGSAPLGYIVTASLSGSTISTTSQSAATTITIGGSGTTALASGTTYVVTVTAIYNSTFTSPLNSSASINGTTNGLAATNLAFSSATATAITVTYTPPTVAPSSYTITATPTGTKTYNQQIITAVSSSPIYTVTGLTPGTTYSITISAIYLNNTATTSAVSGSTLSNLATNLSLNSIGLYSIDVSFALPTYSVTNTSQLFYGYAVPVGGQRSQPTVQTTNIAASALTNVGIPITGLISGTTYNIYVYSIYDTGNIASAYISGNTLSNPPTSLIVTDSSYNYVTVSVTAPTGSSPVSYFASYFASSNTGASYTNTSTQASTTFKLSSLNAGTSYNIHVSSVYETGNLITSDISGNTTAIAVTISGTTVSNQSATINFTALSDQSLPTNYYAVVNPSLTTLGQSIITSSTVAGSSNSIPVSGLTCGTLYNNVYIYSVFTNTTVYSSSSSFTTLAPAPTITSLTSSVNSITIYFSAPSPATSGLTYFAKAITTDGLTSIDTSNNLTTATNITIPGLTTSTSYNIFVSAYYSSTILGTTAYASNPASTTVVAPTGLYNSNLQTVYSLIVAFTPVTSSGATAPTKYTAYAYVSSTDSTIVTTADGAGSPITLGVEASGSSSLIKQNGTYFVKVAAVYPNSISYSTGVYMSTK